MRNGAIVVATLEEVPSYGVVKHHDNNGLAAMFPVIETQSSIKLVTKEFKKSDGTVSRDHAVERSGLGMFLRQLTGIPQEVKEVTTEPSNQ